MFDFVQLYFEKNDYPVGLVSLNSKNIFKDCDYGKINWNIDEKILRNTKSIGSLYSIDQIPYCRQ
jgi:hypothetical protein